jgi:hypothetical protein
MTTVGAINDYRPLRLEHKSQPYSLEWLRQLQLDKVRYLSSSGLDGSIATKVPEGVEGQPRHD